MSRSLQGLDLKYSTMQKQACALVKSVEKFRVYVGYYRKIAFVPHSVVKDILTQVNFLGARAMWVSNIQEYN